MQTIAIINKKGGTGKTTTAINLGAALAREGKRVLMVDLDPQGSLSFSVGIYKVGYDIANALIGEVRLAQTMVEREGMDVIPSTPDLQKVEIAMGNFHRREEVLKSMLAETSNYDFTIIDCPPGSHILQLNALIAANWTIVPLQIETLNVKGLLQIEQEIGDIQKLHNPGLRMLGALPIACATRRGWFRNKTRQRDKLITHMKEKLKIKFMKTSIRDDQHIKEAPAQGQSIFQFAPQSTGAQDYSALATEVIKRTRVKTLTLA